MCYFDQEPRNHYLGGGCKQCLSEKISGPRYSERNTTEEFIKQAKSVHNDKYEYFQTFYESSKTKVIITCKEHGNFVMTPNKHLRGQGCKKCGNLSKGVKWNMTLEDFINKSSKIHYNRYDYSQTKLLGYDIKMPIVCKKHGVFLQSPHSHLYGNGCSKCRFSRGESAIFNFLKVKSINFETQKSFNDCRNPKTRALLFFDFYLPDYNVLIEYDGQQHFVKTKDRSFWMSQKDIQGIKYRDSIKNKYAKRKTIKLIRIKYTKFNKIDEILEKELKEWQKILPLSI